MALAAWESLAKELEKRDKRLRPFIRDIGYPVLELETDAFRALAQSILAQQLATRAAEVIIERFRKLAPPFPRPSAVLSLTPRRLRTAGVSPQKMGYLKALAERWQDASWRRGWTHASDEAVVERLTEVKGIGVWTAHMFLIFSLGRPNVLPVGDYGVRKGMQKIFGLSELPLPGEMLQLVPHWEGAYSVGAWYLWQAQDRKLL